MDTLTPEQRRHLRALAHPLHPTVMIGDAGLSEAVLKEIDRTLKAHELIKIKVHGGERDDRIEIEQLICERLGALPVQRIGKMLVIYRPADPPRLHL